MLLLYKGNNKITELRTILQRESQKVSRRHCHVLLAGLMRNLRRHLQMNTSRILDRFY
jgi:hypothetical protein